MSSLVRARIGSVQDLDVIERTICGWDISSVRPSQGRL